MVVLEAIGVLFGFISVYYAILKSSQTWAWGIANGVFLSAVFFSQALYGLFCLQLLFIFSGVVGWLRWEELGSKYITIFLSALLLSCVLILKNNFVDTTAFILGSTATILLIEKQRLCWIVFILSNILSIYVCLESELYVSVIQYIIFIVLSVNGFIIWQKQH